jgi:hypothetical protein
VTRQHIRACRLKKLSPVPTRCGAASDADMIDWCPPDASADGVTESDRLPLYRSAIE